MGRIVDLSPTAMRTTVFGDSSNVMAGYLQYQMSQMGPSMDGSYNPMMDVLNNSYNIIIDPLRQQAINLELEGQGLKDLDNHFVELSSFTELQNANLTMQRWILAHPETRMMYNQQNISGYNNEYYDIEQTVGVDDYDYRRVTNGIVMDDENGVDSHFFIFNEELKPGDRELTYWEQDKILGTWGTINEMLRTSKLDYTNDSEKPKYINYD